MGFAYQGYSPVAFGVLDGIVATPVWLGEHYGFTTSITDGGVGIWTLGVDAQVGLPSAVTPGGVAIVCSPFNTASTAAGAVVASGRIASATSIVVNAVDLQATPALVDAQIAIQINRWPT